MTPHDPGAVMSNATVLKPPLSAEAQSAWRVAEYMWACMNTWYTQSSYWHKMWAATQSLASVVDDLQFDMNRLGDGSTLLQSFMHVKFCAYEVGIVLDVSTVSHEDWIAAVRLIESAMATGKAPKFMLDTGGGGDT